MSDPAAAGRAAGLKVIAWIEATKAWAKLLSSTGWLWSLAILAVLLNTVMLFLLLWIIVHFSKLW